MRFIIDGIEDRSAVGEKCANLVDHQAFQVAGRYPPAACTGPARSGEEGSRNIVLIACSLLDRIGWRQALAGLVKNQAGQQTGVACAPSRCPLHAVCGQHGPDITGIGTAFVGYLARTRRAPGVQAEARRWAYPAGFGQGLRHRLQPAPGRLAEPAMRDFLKPVTEGKDKQVAADFRRLAVVEPPPFAPQVLEAERPNAIDLALGRSGSQRSHG